MENEKEITEKLDLDGLVTGPLRPAWQTHFLVRAIGKHNGTFVFNYTNTWITCDSIVVVSASEYVRSGSFPWGCAHMGDANVQVLNVSPYNGGFRVRIKVDNSEPLPIRIHMIMRVLVT